MTKWKGSRKRMTKRSSHSWKDNSGLSWKLEERLRNQTSWLWIHIGTLAMAHMKQQNHKIRCKRWRKQIGLNAIDWNKGLRYERVRLVGAKDWDKKNEIQWSYEGKRCSGIEQHGRTNKANKQLPGTNSENWKASTLTPGSKQQRGDGTWSNWHLPWAEAASRELV